MVESTKKGVVLQGHKVPSTALQPSQQSGSIGWETLVGPRAGEKENNDSKCNDDI